MNNIMALKVDYVDQVRGVRREGIEAFAGI
jgi:hypothetical protein